MTENLGLNKIVDVMTSSHVRQVRNHICQYLYRSSKFEGTIYSKDKMYIVPDKYRRAVSKYLKVVVSTLCLQSYEHSITVYMLNDILEHDVDQRMIELDDYLFGQAGFRMAYVMANMVVSVCNAIELYETVKVTKIYNEDCRNATVDILYVMFAQDDNIDVECHLYDDNMAWKEYIVCGDVHFPSTECREGVRFSVYDYNPKVMVNAVVISKYAFTGAYRLGCGFIYIDISAVEEPVEEECDDYDIEVNEEPGHYCDLDQIICELSCDTVVITDDPCIGIVDEYPHVRVGDIDDISSQDRAIIIYHSLSTSLLDTLTCYLAKHEYNATVYIVESCISEKYSTSKGTLRKELDRVFLGSRCVKRDERRILLSDVIKWCVRNKVTHHGREFLKYHDYYDGWIYWFKPDIPVYTQCVGTGSMVIHDVMFIKYIRGLLSWVRKRYLISCDEWCNVTTPVAGSYSYGTFLKSVEAASEKIFDSDVEYGEAFFDPVQVGGCKN